MTAEEWLEAYREAWQRRDPDRAAALFTDDATYQEEPCGEVATGLEGIRAYWARVTSIQRDVEVRLGVPLVQGRRVAVEWWTTMENAGARITLAGEFMLTFDESGRCRRLREYWHALDGTHLPPDDWGS